MDVSTSTCKNRFGFKANIQLIQVSHRVMNESFQLPKETIAAFLSLAQYSFFSALIHELLITYSFVKNINHFGDGFGKRLNFPDNEEASGVRDGRSSNKQQAVNKLTGDLMPSRFTQWFLREY